MAMMSPTHWQTERSPSNVFAVLKLAPTSNSTSQDLSKPSSRPNLARSVHQMLKSTFQQDGTLRAPFLRGIGTSFTIAMDDSYDYNVLGDTDPDDLQQELLKHVTEVCKLMQNLTPNQDVAVDDYIVNILCRLVYGSNMIENAGAGHDVTFNLCQAVFRGEEISEKLSEIDEEYTAIMQDLQRRNLSTDYESVLRSCREIIQHAEAVNYIINELYIGSGNLTEEIILKTHRILTDKIDSEQGISWTTYSGVYRQDDVSAGLHQFIPPEWVRYHMKSMIREMTSDLEKAAKFEKIDPIASSAKYCHIFVNIHPFLDGNGRLCRLILNAMLLKYGGSMVCFGEQEDDRQKYLDIATDASLMESSQADEFDSDEEFKPKHYRQLATFTLQKVTENMRDFVQALQGKN